jgi:hypothetical protein
MSDPVCISNCSDCGIGCIAAGEWFSVSDDVWEEAWAGSRKPWHGKVIGQEILCVGCLERRIGRKLTGHDISSARDSGLMCCEDCRVPPRLWGPMLRDELWTAIAHKDAFLCFDCIEHRLGRMLTQADVKFPQPLPERAR